MMSRKCGQEASSHFHPQITMELLLVQKLEKTDDTTSCVLGRVDERKVKVEKNFRGLSLFC